MVSPIVQTRYRSAPLRRWAPQAIHWTEIQDLVPVLDAFEEAMDAGPRSGVDATAGVSPH